MSTSKVYRYHCYIAGIKIDGDAAAGIKGLSSPTGSINFDASFTQDGTEAPIVKEEWIRGWVRYITMHDSKNSHARLWVKNINCHDDNVIDHINKFNEEYSLIP